MLSLDSGTFDKSIALAIDARREIHRFPELAYQEQRTSALVLSTLRNIGIHAQNVCGTGVVGTLNGKDHGPTVMLRADMDALPITENTGCSYSSAYHGIMHACGHDIHTAILLGTAHYLVFNHDFAGTVKFVFQPAEEENPDGGARRMIKAGVLHAPEVKAGFALHVWPEFNTGTIALRDGTMMAASDRIKITIHGKSAHAAKPHLGVDTIAIAANVINNVQNIISRNIDPLDSAVITFGKIHGGAVANIIADNVEIYGSIRSLNENTRIYIRDRLYAVTQHICKAHTSKCDIDYQMGHPSTQNDAELASITRQALRSAFLPEHIISDVLPAMTAEDFAYYTHKIPSVLMWLGCRPQNVSEENFPGLHNNAFLPDEACIAEGIKAFLVSVYSFFHCAINF